MGIVANALARAGHEVVQFDFLHSGQSLEKLADALRSQMPALAGISIRNIDNVNLVSEQHYINTVRRIVMAIRSVIKAPIVLGGAGFQLCRKRSWMLLAQITVSLGRLNQQLLTLWQVLSAANALRDAFELSIWLIQRTSVVPSMTRIL